MKIIFSSFIALALGLSAFSQNQPNNGVRSEVDWSPQVYEEGSRYSGYIIELNGDTVYGYIKALSRASVQGMGHNNQNRVYFYMKKDDRKPVDKYKADELKGYLIADKLYESIKYSGGLFNKPNFNLVLKDGAIRLYEWYSTKDGFSMMKKQSGESWADFDARRYQVDLIVAKTADDPMNYSMLGIKFAKKMPELISDHKELASKVANKEKGYKWTNFFEVIEAYNEWAAAKN